MSTETINSEWLAQQLKTLLSSPYIHFSQPPAGLHGLRLGPGPIDLFSTRFENLFSNDATGVVAGEEVDRADLKQALLALQRTWNPDTLNISAPYTPDPEQVEYLRLLGGLIRIT